MAPERTLITSILVRALMDYFGQQQKLKSEAAEWFFDEDLEAERPFSYAWICRSLGLEASLLSDWIRQTDADGADFNPRILRFVTMA